MAAVRRMEITMQKTPEEQKKVTIHCISVARNGTNLTAFCKTFTDMLISTRYSQPSTQ